MAIQKTQGNTEMCYKKQIEHILNKKKYVVNTTKNVTNYKNISENKESLWFYGISEVS